MIKYLMSCVVNKCLKGTERRQFCGFQYLDSPEKLSLELNFTRETDKRVEEKQSHQDRQDQSDIKSRVQ